MEVRRNVRRRAGAVLIGCAALFSALLLHLFNIQILGHERFSNLRDRQSWSVVLTEGQRGSIHDATGRTLAVSVPVQSVYADPKRTSDKAAVDLASALSLDPLNVHRLLSRDSRFVWLKRKITEEEERKIRELEIPGVGFRREYLRVYPGDALASHLLGLVDIDDAGGMGLELSLDRTLGGRSSRTRVRVDALRKPVSSAERHRSGANVRLTLHSGIQEIVEEEIDAAVTEWSPKWISIVVLDPRTGAVVAMANRPTFDPNRPGEASPSAWPNRAVSNPYEPGSTLKPFFVAAALEEGLVRPEMKFECKGSWTFGPRRLRCHKAHGVLTVRQIISKSCNVGAARIGAQILGAKRLHRYAAAFGLGSRTGVEVPHESAGVLKPLRDWTPHYTSSSVSIGHEISMTPLQLAAAAAVIANGGVWRPTYLVDRVTDEAGAVLHRHELHEGRRVVSANTAARIREMMVETVEEGTGKRVKLDGLRIAAKTGTSQKYDPATRSYDSKRYTSSFVSFAPAESARMVVVVVVDEPQGAYYGGRVAGPVARNILSRGLPLLK